MVYKTTKKNLNEVSKSPTDDEQERSRVTSIVVLFLTSNWAITLA